MISMFKAFQGFECPQSISDTNSLILLSHIIAITYRRLPVIFSYRKIVLHCVIELCRIWTRLSKWYHQFYSNLVRELSLVVFFCGVLLLDPQLPVLCRETRYSKSPFHDPNRCGGTTSSWLSFSF